MRLLTKFTLIDFAHLDRNSPFSQELEVSTAACGLKRSLDDSRNWCSRLQLGAGPLPTVALAQAGSNMDMNKSHSRHTTANCMRPTETPSRAAKWVPDPKRLARRFA